MQKAGYVPVAAFILPETTKRLAHELAEQVAPHLLRILGLDRQQVQPAPQPFPTNPGQPQQAVVDLEQLAKVLQKDAGQQ